jgi:alpha-L-rhamnosidase
MPLVVGLASDGEEERALASLVRRIEQDGRARTAGDIGFHYVIEALSRAGRGDLFFAMRGTRSPERLQDRPAASS